MELGEPELGWNTLLIGREKHLVDSVSLGVLTPSMVHHLPQTVVMIHPVEWFLWFSFVQHADLLLRLEEAWMLVDF